MASLSPPYCIGRAREAAEARNARLKKAKEAERRIMSVAHSHASLPTMRTTRLRRARTSYCCISVFVFIRRPFLLRMCAAWNVGLEARICNLKILWE